MQNWFLSGTTRKSINKKWKFVKQKNEDDG